MTTLEASAAAERLAAGQLVLVGDESDDAVFITAAADRIGAGQLAELHDLGRGSAVLGMSDSAVERLRLHAPAGRAAAAPLRIGVAIDAAGSTDGGWSLGERARTMRVAARAESGPRDLHVPGHVLTARIAAHGGGAASAALELARIAGSADAVALAAVLDHRGAVARLAQALQWPRLRHVAHVSSAELRSHAVGRGAGELAAACRLPTRDGRFRAVAFGIPEEASATVALIHGEPGRHADPFVHVHVACRLGDVFGSLLCVCRAELEAATSRILERGSGVIVYVPSPDPTQLSCPRELPVDPGLIAGMLRLAEVKTSERPAGNDLEVAA